jgi:acid stress-induced BolA-like protein IbaG/YrbA
MDFTAQQYLDASQERIEDARVLRESSRFAPGSSTMESSGPSDLLPRLRAALLLLALPGVELELETSHSGRVSGAIISPAFAGRPQSERQALVWAHLREHLPAPELAAVLILFTLTPAEASEDVEESA